MDENRFDARLHPSSIIRAMLDELGWDAEDLREYSGLPGETVRYVLSDWCTAIRLDEAAMLGRALGTTAGFWLMRWSEYRAKHGVRGWKQRQLERLRRWALRVPS